MPTPQARLAASAEVTDAVILDRLLPVYNRLFTEFYDDLKIRMDLWGQGLLWGGSDAPEVPAKFLARNIRGLKATMVNTYGPAAIEGLNGNLDAAFVDDALAWVDQLPNVPGAVPAWYVAQNPDWAVKWKTFLKNGSLVEKKLLEGAYIKGGLNSLHAKLYEKTRFHLQSNLNSGKSYQQIMTEIEKGIWKIDITQVGPDQRALNWIRRLIRSEYQYAMNSARQDLYQAIPEVIGYEIALDPDHCPICAAEYGQRFFYYDQDGTLTPPDESHPNCHCTIVRAIWKRPEQTTLQVKEIHRRFQYPGPKI